MVFLGNIVLFDVIWEIKKIGIVSKVVSKLVKDSDIRK